MHRTPRVNVAARVIPVVAASLVVLTCGCSTFNKDWRAAGKSPAVENSIEGRWEGRWVSEANGHKGKLRCLMSRQTDGDYAARFRATYMKVLRFSYTVPMKVERRDGDWHFRGEADLGKMAGGVYQYEGSATRTNFHSTYRSKHDHGIFEMQRPAEASGQ